MKWALGLLVICLISFSTACSDPPPEVKEILHYLELFPKDKILASITKYLKTFPLQSNELKDADINSVNGDARANGIYQLVENLINGQLAGISDFHIDNLNIPPSGGASWGISLEQITISGLNNSKYSMPGVGYNADITLNVPGLVVTADRYKIENVNLSIITLNGEGTLRIELSEFNIMAIMEAKYKYPTINVTNVPGISFGLQKSDFKLENLGGEGDAISELLNGIVSEVLPTAIASASEDINTHWNDICANHNPILGTLFTGIFQVVFDQIFCIITPSTCKP